MEQTGKRGAFGYQNGRQRVTEAATFHATLAVAGSDPYRRPATGASTFHRTLAVAGSEPYRRPATGASTFHRTLAVAGSEPYPWPYDGAAVAEHTAVLVVAAQGGLVRFCATAAEAIAVIATLTSAARLWGAKVIATRHAASPAQRRPGLLPGYGQPGWELLAGLEPDAVVDAFGVDGFSGSPLAECLAGLEVDHLLICGLGLEGPVHSTLRSANDRGLECLLVVDGCAPLDLALADAGVRIIEMSGGIFGAVAQSVAVLTALGAQPTPFSPPLEV